MSAASGQATISAGSPSTTIVLALTDDATAEVTEEFTVTIEGRPEPITFKAYGRVAGK